MNQRQTLVRIKERISWHQAFEEIPAGFTLMIANELFDAIPIHQFVKTANGFRERVVGLDEARPPRLRNWHRQLRPVSAAR
jgi:SAM-dependent MidA family methyltransferase